MRLYFIRHGESTSNYGEFIIGQCDVLLTDHGRDQARMAGKRMAAEGISFDSIISSPLHRARTTAQLIAQEIGYPEEDIQSNSVIKERSFGSLEGKRRAEYDELSEEFIHDNGGELQTQVRDRAQAFLDSLQSTTGSILVVSHTGFGRWLCSLATGVPIDHFGDLQNAELIDLGKL